MSERPGVVTVFDTRQLAETAKEVLDLWWLWLVRGALAILVGIVAWAWPGLTLTTLIWLVGAYIVVDGVLSVIGFFRHGDLSWGRRFLLLFWGSVQVIAGVILWFAPGVGVVTMMLIFGIWAMLTGMFLVVSAFTRDGHLMSPWIQGIIGILGIVVGMYLVVHPGAGSPGGDLGHRRHRDRLWHLPDHCRIPDSIAAECVRGKPTDTGDLEQVISSPSRTVTDPCCCSFR